MHNHREIRWRTIRSVSYSGKEKTYDICMKSPFNSFIANDFVVHNSWSFNKSHSVSYTMISYWTMWLKVYYPMEFYSSILSLIDNKTNKKNIIKEYKKEGYKILPIDINKSKKHFSIEEKGLRIGFQDIKGIGPGAAKTILKNQPFKSYEDFCNKVLGKRVKETSIKHLVNLGAFDCVKGNGNLNLFGEIAIDAVKKEMSFSERFEVCPWDMEFGIDDKWLPFLKEHKEKFPNLPTKISYLKEIEGNTDAIIYGIVYDKNLKNAQEEAASKGRKLETYKYTCKKCKGCLNYDKINNPESKCENLQFQFANFVIEDDTDFITVRLSHRVFPEYGNLIFEQIKADDVIIIKGKMGQGIRLFFADKIISLRHYKESLNEK